MQLAGYSGADDYWSGLTNPDGVACIDADCTDQLKWADGTDFKWDGTIHRQEKEQTHLRKSVLLFYVQKILVVVIVEDLGLFYFLI